MHLGRAEPIPQLPGSSLIHHATGPGVGVGWPPQEDPNAPPTCLLHCFTEDRRSGQGSCMQVTCMSPVRWLPRSVHPVGTAAPVECYLVRGQLPAGLQNDSRCPVRQTLAAPETDRGATFQCKESRFKTITTKQKQGRYFSINSK